MGKTCDWCEFSQCYICNPAEHCGLCPKGHIDEEPKLNGMKEEDY